MSKGRKSLMTKKKAGRRKQGRKEKAVSYCNNFKNEKIEGLNFLLSYSSWVDPVPLVITDFLPSSLSAQKDFRHIFAACTLTKGLQRASYNRQSHLSKSSGDQSSLLYIF